MDDVFGVFGEHRNLLFTLAYDVLGSVADAEDVVRDTWLRWSRVDRAEVVCPRAYLVHIAVRRSLDRLRALRTARESHVGPWLPEPLVNAEDPESGADRISRGLLVVLETLSPPERAAFVLGEAFGFEHAEIARILNRTPAAARQLTHRARAHVQAARPRSAADPGQARRAAERFVAAALGGSLAELLDVLAPDVTLWNDGGGQVRVALRPVRGAEKVARLLSRIGPRLAGCERRWAGATCLLMAGGEVRAALTVELDASGTRILEAYGLAHPDKLPQLR
ncbi:sigma factor-like helix-turn-helix DNA-binding protein [Nonomuraea zeae]|uniref:sigma factor-like helix-turn-helix DNA-binding protein n=1 Tax=Nonomuraea zeae TaxID=1642303 RepID=UPI00197CD947|nr:sigma factor-like helix-turn-helix DNA-binding protein [Nonomuraea zeae]